MASTENVPLDYIIEQLEHEVYRHYQGRPTEANVETDISEPEWMDGMGDWLITIGDLITEDALDRQEDVIHVNAEDDAEDESYEIRRRNATGGDYAKVRQHISINGELAFKQDEQYPDETIVDPERTNLEFVCHFDTRGHRSFSGETPPF